MPLFLHEALHYLKGKIEHPNALFVSIIFFFLSWVFSIFHYTNIYYGNSLSWIGWVIATGTFSYSFLPKHISFKTVFSQIQRPDILIALFVIILYWTTHLWNFSTAPWNLSGLFDDAAWDIYFAKNHVFNGTVFQAAFFDTVGYISREVVFHYYISIFFKVFGYNLLVFNISLMILGFVTVLTTTFIIHRLFRNKLVTIVSAIILNFFPLHYMHIFMGHRYAIAAPLMVVSLYFLYTSFINNSLFRASISALFAALCWDSAIMGKQFILGLILSAFCIVIFDRRWKSKKNVANTLVWIVSFTISATPLLVYILFNYHGYVLHEQSLSREFFSMYRNGGFLAIKPYFDQIIELFFTKYALKMFLPGFYIIPLPYYLLLIPGFWVVLMKKRFEIVFLTLIPILATLVSGSYDFRVLLAVPIWIICIAFCLDYLFNFSFRLIRDIRSKLIAAISLFFILAGLFPSVKYLWNVSKNPNYVHLLSHRDVAASRLVQDIVAGSPNPTSAMKRDEFNRKTELSKTSYDTLACPYTAYAVMHLYLQNYDDKKILSFCDQGPQLVQTPMELLSNNTRAIQTYKPHTKDLKMIWEISGKSEPIIDIFREYKKYGSEEVFSDSIDGIKYSLYVLTVRNDNIRLFQRDILRNSP